MFAQIIPNILSGKLASDNFKAIDETDVVKGCAVGPNTVQFSSAIDHCAVALPRLVKVRKGFFDALVTGYCPSHEFFEAMEGLSTWKHHLKVGMQVSLGLR
jgi:hypothetical protein